MRLITKSHGKLRPYRIYDALDILENHPYQVVKIDGQPYLIEAWKLEDILTPKEIEQLSLPDGQELDLKTLLENIGNSEYKKYLLQSTVTPPTVLSWMLAHQYEDIFFEKESEASHDLGERPLINPAKPVIATSLETAPSEIVPLYSTLKRESVLIEEQWLKDIWHKHQSCPEVEGVTLKITPTRVELPIITDFHIKKAPLKKQKRN